jgi:MFS transporter, AAHS family, 4-hydroxybenzoate transporter
MNADVQQHDASDAVQPIHIRVLALCALVTLVEGIDLTLIPLLAPTIARSWSLQPAALGIIFSAGPVGLILGGLGVGYLADRIGRRGALLAAMVLMTVATLVTALATTVPQLLVCRVLTGIAFGGVIPAAVALVSEFLPVRLRANVVALVILGQALGALLAALLMKLPMSAGPWQSMIVYAGLACGAVTLLLLALLPESPRYLTVRNAPRGRFGDLFAEGRATGTALLWVTFIGVCWAVSFFTNWLTAIYTHAGKPAAAGVDAMAMYSGGAVIGGLLLPLFTLRWHVNKVLLATILVGAATCAALGVVLSLDTSFSLAVSLLCGVFVSGAFFLLYPPAVGFYPTAIRSTGIGAAVAFGRLGNMASPAVAGFMLSAGLAPVAVFVAMALPMVMSAGALWLFHRHVAHAAHAALFDRSAHGL